MSDPNSWQRMLGLLEIRLNSLLPGARGGAAVAAYSFDEVLRSLRRLDLELWALLQPSGPAESAVADARDRFGRNAARAGQLRIPTAFNPDITLAAACYAFVRRLKPRQIVETGVGYGITTAVMLAALRENDGGRLVSVDLPSLRDPQGEQAGLAVSADLAKDRWSYRTGSIRRDLPTILAEVAPIDLFVSDSANIATLQRFEWRSVQPMLSSTGAALFNNVSRSFVRTLLRTEGTGTCLIHQREKPGCVTALVVREGACGLPVC